MTTPTAPIARAEAVRTIAGHLLDRDKFIITAPQDVIAAVAQHLVDIPATAYLDSGLSNILTLTGPMAMSLLAALAETLPPFIAVITIPKTVPARVLGEALAQPIPDDGSQDTLILSSAPGKPICWPLLFVEAVEVVDPRVAAQIRASDLTTAN